MGWGDREIQHTESHSCKEAYSTKLPKPCLDHQAAWVGDPVSDSPTPSFHFWEGFYTQREDPALPGASFLSSLQISQRT